MLRKSLQVFCVRQSSRGGKVSSDSTLVLDLAAKENLRDPAEVKCLGWERNLKGQLLPRVVNMKVTMRGIHMSGS